MDEKQMKKITKKPLTATLEEIDEYQGIMSAGFVRTHNWTPLTVCNVPEQLLFAIHILVQVRDGDVIPQSARVVSFVEDFNGDLTCVPDTIEQLWIGRTYTGAIPQRLHAIIMNGFRIPPRGPRPCSPAVLQSMTQLEWQSFQEQFMSKKEMKLTSTTNHVIDCFGVLVGTVGGVHMQRFSTHLNNGVHEGFLRSPIDNYVKNLKPVRETPISKLLLAFSKVALHNHRQLNENI